MTKETQKNKKKTDEDECVMCEYAAMLDVGRDDSQFYRLSPRRPTGKWRPLEVARTYPVLYNHAVSS